MLLVLWLILIANSKEFVFDLNHISIRNSLIFHLMILLVFINNIIILLLII